MNRTHPHLPIALFATLAISLTTTACGSGEDGNGDGDGADPAALAEAFEQEAIAAYESQDLSREDDFARGIFDIDCFILDEEGAAAVGEAIAGSGEVEVTEGSFLRGVPAEDESLSCPLGAGDEVRALSVTAGTTLVDRDQLLARFLREDGATEIEGDTGELDPDEVAAVEVLEQRRFAWVADDFLIGISAPATELEPDEGYAALAVAIDEVERTLAE